ncbi:dodecin family protein [Olivibacter jilunii]|uniref:dodecin family protein n=1 Tax=Olivibacter jilunii TaxID=985016 RepID=UPI003F15D873
MALVKVIEVIAASETSFDDAIKNAVKEVTKTVKNVDSVYVKDFKVHVENDEIKSFGAVCKVSFRVDENVKNGKQG